MWFSIQFSFLCCFSIFILDCLVNVHSQEKTGKHTGGGDINSWIWYIYVLQWRNAIENSYENLECFLKQRITNHFFSCVPSAFQIFLFCHIIILYHLAFPSLFLHSFIKINFSTRKKKKSFISGWLCDSNFGMYAEICVAKVCWKIYAIFFL